MNVTFIGTLLGTHTQVEARRGHDGTVIMSLSMTGAGHTDSAGLWHSGAHERVDAALKPADAVALAVAIASADVGLRHDVARRLGYVDPDEREDAPPCPGCNDEAHTLAGLHG